MKVALKLIQVVDVPHLLVKVNLEKFDFDLAMNVHGAGEAPYLQFLI
jgi:hypothetical protein